MSKCYCISEQQTCSYSTGRVGDFACYSDCYSGNNYCCDGCDFVPYTALALCEARHDMPQNVHGAIFSTNVNPLDVSGLTEEAKRVLEPLKNGQVDIYVTGLTVALISALNACKELNITVNLYHFNRDTNEYYRQEVI